MRILVIGRFFLEGFGAHIADTLEKMGHSVLRVDPEVAVGIPKLKGVTQVAAMAIGALTDIGKRIPFSRRLLLRHIWRTIEGQNIDLTIVCSDFLWPDEVARLKCEISAPVVLWFPDAISSFHRAFFFNAPYDILFFKDPYVVSSLRGCLTRSIYYLPECCNPARHYPIEISASDAARYGCEIATAGNLYTYRAAFFEQLQEFDVRIWGASPPVWMDSARIGHMIQHHFVGGEEKARAFLAAAIVLNNLYPAEIWGVNVRTFEAAAVGAFQMVDWRPGLGQLFDDGKELINFRGIADLKQKIRWWLPRAEQRREIGLAGHRRANRDHTYERRLILMLNTVGGRDHGYPLPAIAYSE